MEMVAPDQVRWLKLYENCAIRESNGRLRVALVSRSGKVVEAFLNPKKIERVVEVRYKDNPWPQYYIMYRSNHKYYDSLDWPEPRPGAQDRSVVGGAFLIVTEVKETRLNINPWWIKRVGKNKFKIYLREAERWDHFAFSFLTCMRIWVTNIHPYYGVMD
ncbi:MAG: hypothetical protein DRJ67_12305 [Thermoprotei archaeon]|nr:MAG: hypothetical protein DRJ67_12305 [Thermoprotei archaeon]